MNVLRSLLRMPVLMALLCPLLAVPALAGHDAHGPADCGGDMSPADRMHCENVQMDAADKALGRVYEVLMDSLDGNARAMLFEAQRGWLAYREANFGIFSSAASTRGQLGLVEQVRSMRLMTEARARELENLYRLLREGGMLHPGRGPASSDVADAADGSNASGGGDGGGGLDSTDAGNGTDAAAIDSVGIAGGVSVAGGTDALEDGADAEGVGNAHPAGGGTSALDDDSSGGTGAAEAAVPSGTRTAADGSPSGEGARSPQSVDVSVSSPALAADRIAGTSPAGENASALAADKAAGPPPAGDGALNHADAAAEGAAEADASRVPVSGSADAPRASVSGTADAASPPPARVETADISSKVSADGGRPAPPPVAVKSQKALALLLGEHPLKLQWLSSARPGRVVIRERNGALLLTGRQTGEGGELIMDGYVSTVREDNFTFHGTVTTRIGFLNEGRGCARTGRMWFVRKRGRPFWRLQAITNPCCGVSDYVDIYVSPGASGR